MHAFLVYNETNKNIADAIERDLSRLGISFRHDTRLLHERDSEFRNFSELPSAPIVLLISDNFLKSKDCMYEALKLLQTSSLKSRIFPVVTDGKYKNPLGGTDYIPTKFERVSNVIHYMNYWQDQYLDLRKKKHDIDSADEEKFGKELQVVRSISSEIGEFLRILRGSDYVDYKELQSNGFERFFRRSGWSHLAGEYKKLPALVVEEEGKPATLHAKLKEEIGVKVAPVANGIADIKEEIKEKKEEVKEAVKEPVVEIQEELKDGLSDVVEEKVDIPEVELKTPEIEAREEINTDIPEKINVEVSEIKEEVADSFEDVKEEILDDLPEAPLPLSETPEKEIVSEDKEEMLGDDKSYEDKSSYDLLVSLFDEDDEKNSPEVPKLEEEDEEARLLRELKEEILLAEKEDEEDEEDEDDLSFDDDFLEDEDDDVVAVPIEVLAMVDQEDFTGAVAELKKILAADPGNHEARFIYASVLQDKLKNVAEAKEQFEIIDENTGDHVYSVLRLAEIAELEEDFLTSRSYYEKALSINHEYPGLHYKLGVLLADNFRAQKKKATKHFKIAYQQDTDNTDALYRYAVLMHEHQGKPKKALKAFMKVAQLEPEHPFAHYDIAVIYYEMGKGELAAKYYHDAIKHNPDLWTEKNDEAFQVGKYYPNNSVRPDEVLHQEDLEMDATKEESETLEMESIPLAADVPEIVTEEKPVEDLGIIDENQEKETLETIPEETLDSKEEIIDESEPDLPLEEIEENVVPEAPEMEMDVVQTINDAPAEEAPLEVVYEIVEPDVEEEQFDVVYETVVPEIPEIEEEESVDTKVLEDMVEEPILEAPVVKEEEIVIAPEEEAFDELTAEVLEISKEVEDEVEMDVPLEEVKEELSADIPEEEILPESEEKAEDPVEENEDSLNLKETIAGGAALITGGVVVDKLIGKEEEAPVVEEEELLDNPFEEELDEELEEVIDEVIEEIPVDEAPIAPALEEPVTEPTQPETEEVLAPIAEAEIPVQKELKDLVMITGATSGIGKASAILFAEKGHDLIITGRRKGRLEALKEELEESYGVGVQIIEFDVRSLDACRKAVDSLNPCFKEVDILINNAGLAKGKGPIHEGDIDHWETMIDTNIKGLLYMTRLIAPGMVSRNKGHIINVGSVAGKDVYPGGNVYCATKHAVDALNRAMRIDLHKYNIRVSSVAPGAVEETEFSLVRHDFDAEKADKTYADFKPLKASDVAEVIYFTATRPAHVNIQDIVLWGTQQASVHYTDKSGRDDK